MGITFSDVDLDTDENTVQIAALTPSDNAVIIGNGTAWTTESGPTLRASLGLAIGSDVMAYDADLATWAGVTPGTGIATALAVNVGTAGAPVINGGALGTPSSGTLTSATGLPVSTGISGLGTGIATALAVNTGSAGAPVLFNGALGAPASGTLTNCTGLPNASVVGLGTAALTTYETGTFTPTIGFATDGDLSVNYSGGAQLGFYTKIGTRVFFELQVSVSSLTFTTASGNVRISGLPYTVASGGAERLLVHVSSSHTWPTSTTNVTGLPVSGTTYVELRGIGPSIGAAAWTISHIASGSTPNIQIVGSYRV